MKQADEIKLFHLNKDLLVSDLSSIEQTYGYDIYETKDRTGKDEAFYPQFPAVIRRTAKAMASHYEIFYCLENYIRDLVSDTLSADFGDNWWNEKVPSTVNENVEKNIKREVDAGISARSQESIDYTTFGELSNIIDSNWDSFSDTFNSRKGLVAVLARLNLLRGPIAHCSELTEDEVLRLQLSLRDYFRLME